MANPADNNDSDPIKASYDVYIKPTLENGQKLYVLQFPNRRLEESYTALNNCAPHELRVKPKSGLIELDVPIESDLPTYDRHKGTKWGDALKQSSAKSGTTYGLPGGFGIGSAGGGRGRGRTVKEESIDDFTGITNDRWAKMKREGRVMGLQTLGGQAVPVEDSSPTYMMGAFRNDQLHLTPVSQIVQLRPQFHHIDAKLDAERQSRPRDPAAGPPAAARAIHMTAKTIVDGEEARADTMIERIRSAQEETWRKLKYVDENGQEAWDSFERSMFVNINPEAEDASMVGEHGGATSAVPEQEKLKSSMTNAEYLDAISAPRDEAKLRESKKDVPGTKRDRKGKGKAKDKGKGKEKAGEEIDLSDDGDVLM